MHTKLDIYVFINSICIISLLLELSLEKVPECLNYSYFKYNIRKVFLIILCYLTETTAADRHVSPLELNILIPSQRVIAFFLLSVACMVEKQQIPILLSLV